MAKFENSIYAKMWDSREGREVLSIILQDPNLIHSNHTFWRQKFLVDSQITPTQPDGKAPFTMYMRRQESEGMMDMRAPLGDSMPTEKGNAAFYMGVIPDFIAKGYVETAPEREYREKLFEQFGNDELVKGFVNEWLQPKLDGANQTLSNMSAQIMSTGKIFWNFGDGIKNMPVLKADIPTENFLKAGSVVWSDTDNCKILDQVRKIYRDIRDRLGVDIKMQLEITRNQWINNWLTNAQVLEVIRYYNSLNNQILPEVFVANTDMAMKAIRNYNFGDDMPEIVIIEESQRDGSTTVHGWNDNIAVMRPMGYAGVIRRTSILDEYVYKKYGTKLVDRTFAPALGGVALVMNSVINNGNLKEWHSDLMMSAVPALDEFLYHYIIDTTQTSSTTF